MIRLTNVSKRFGAKQILAQASLHVAPGTLVAVKGESGSGKSTLLKLLIGQYLPDEGTIGIAGAKLSEETIPSLRRQMVYVPQQTAALPGETARAFLEAPFLFRVNRLQRPDSEGVGRVLAALGLDQPLLDQEMGRLSGGERQRLAMARALLLRRRIVLLDEPTSAIDATNRDRVLAALRSQPETTILAVTHDPFVLAAADAVRALVGGKLEATDGR